MAIQTLGDLYALENILPEDAYENIFNIIDCWSLDSSIADIEEGHAHGDADKLLSANNRRRFV